MRLSSCCVIKGPWLYITPSSTQQIILTTGGGFNRDFVELLVNSSDETIRMGAIHGIQFLIAARGQVDPPAVIPALMAACNEPALAFAANDALHDLFYKFPQYRPPLTSS